MSKAKKTEKLPQSAPDLVDAELEELRQRRIPVEWDYQTGRITKWQADDNKWSNGFPREVADRNGRKATRWTLGEDARVLLWSFTEPDNPIFIPKDQLTKEQIAKFEREYLKPECVRERAKMKLGELADEDESALQIVRCYVNHRFWKAVSDGKPDALGKTRKGGSCNPDFVERHHEEMCKWFARWLCECIATRDHKKVSSLATILRDAKTLELDPHKKSVFDGGEVSGQLRGVVYRCFLILQDGATRGISTGPWKDDVSIIKCYYNSLLTKKSLDDFVLAEWLALGGSESTVTTGISEARKKLGLSGLPSASSKPNKVVANRKRLAK